MSRRTGLRFNVSQSAFAIKADFPTLESALALRDEALAWVREGKPIYEWPFHTHYWGTEAESEGAEFVAAFTLKEMGPCPCCLPYSPKFKNGFVVWFPLTQVVRFVGGLCFKKMNPKAYQEAMDNMGHRRAREAALEVLAQKVPGVGRTIVQLEGLLGLAAHLDELQKALGSRLDERREIDLWRVLRDGGQLKQIEPYTEVVNGRPVQRETHTVYSSVSGYRLIDPKRKKFEPRLRQAIEHLRVVPVTAGFDDLDWTEKSKAYAAIIEGKKLANSALDEMRECRRFVYVETINTIKAWGKLPNAESKIYMHLDGLHLYVGRTETDATYPIQLSQELDKNIPALEI